MANIVSITVNAQGFGTDYEKARKRALKRLVKAAERLADGRTPDDPGVNTDDRDPGGGPCAPEKFAMEIFINRDVLPEAQSR